MTTLWQTAWVVLKQAFDEGKLVRATFPDGKVFEFTVTSFDDSNGLPVWSMSPQVLGDRKVIDARELSIVD